MSNPITIMATFSNGYKVLRIEPSLHLKQLEFLVTCGGDNFFIQAEETLNDALLVAARLSNGLPVGEFINLETKYK